MKRRVKQMPLTFDHTLHSVGCAWSSAAQSQTRKDGQEDVQVACTSSFAFTGGFACTSGFSRESEMFRGL